VIKTRRIFPSPSYSIVIPNVAVEQQDDRVTSVWIDEARLLLQLSSYVRTSGEQVSAVSRLRERMKTEPAGWQPRDGMHPDKSIDQAWAERLDESGTLWFYAYLLWPHLTIYALISGPSLQMRSEANWATEAVKSIELAVH